MCCEHSAPLLHEKRRAIAAVGSVFRLKANRTKKLRSRMSPSFPVRVRSSPALFSCIPFTVRRHQSTSATIFCCLLCARDNAPAVRRSLFSVVCVSVVRPARSRKGVTISRLSRHIPPISACVRQRMRTRASVGHAERGGLETPLLLPSVGRKRYTQVEQGTTTASTPTSGGPSDLVLAPPNLLLRSLTPFRRC